MTPDTSDVLTLKEAAALLKVHPQTLLTMARKGRIPAAQVGNRWRFRRDRILAWMDDPKAPATPEATAIAPLLAAKTMQTRMKATTREAAIQELVALVDATGLCEDARALSAKVLAQGGAVPATGAAVLHPGRAVPELVRRPMVAYGRVLDGDPTRLFFLACAAREEEHGRLVDALTRMLKDAELCQQIYLQNAPEGVIKLVRAWEEKSGILRP